MIDYAVVPMFTLRLNAMYFTQMIPAVPEWGFILIFGLLIGGICVVGLKLGAVVELVIGISAVIVVFIFNFQAVQEMLQNGVPIFHSEAIYDPDKIIWGGVFNATAIAFMSMLGFDGMTTLAEETKMSTKKMSYAVMTAVIIQALCLLVTTYLMGAVMDWTTIPKDQFPTAYMYMLEIFTSVPFAAFLVTVNNISILACIMAFVTVSSRILFSMGRNGVIPKSFFGHLSPKLNTPVNNIVFITVIAITGALLGDFNVLGELISYGGCVGFFFVNISVISYFWVKQKDKRIFRHLVLPLLASCSIMVVLCNMGKITLTVGITWSIIGLLYLIIGYKMSKTFRDNIDSGHLEM
jgi:putrescine importer